MEALDKRTIHFHSSDARCCGVSGTHRFTFDENEVSCRACAEHDTLELSEEGKRYLATLGY